MVWTISSRGGLEPGGRAVVFFYVMASGGLYFSYLHHNSQSLLIIFVNLDTTLRNTEQMIQIIYVRPGCVLYIHGWMVTINGIQT